MSQGDGTALAVAAGVLLISAADAAGGGGASGTAWTAAYWIGEAIMFAPLVARARQGRVSRAGGRSPFSSDFRVSPPRDRVTP